MEIYVQRILNVAEEALQKLLLKFLVIVFPKQNLQFVQAELAVFAIYSLAGIYTAPRTGFDGPCAI